VIAVACGSSARPRDSRIVLERSIGRVALREPRTDVERVLGKGTTIGNDVNHGHQISYPKAGLMVVYAPGLRDREAVFAVLTVSPRYRTDGGVGVGSSRSAVKAIGGIECYSSTCASAAPRTGSPAPRSSSGTGRSGESRSSSTSTSTGGLGHRLGPAGHLASGGFRGHHRLVWRAKSEPEITREEVTWIMVYLMGIDRKVSEIRSHLLEDEDEQEDS
jgi:hypothetical protein